MLLSFSINTYLYNMILSEETLLYPASYCCPTLIHTCTIWYFQKKHWDIKQHVIVLLHWYIPVQHDIVRRNTKISSIILLSFYINTYLNNMIFSEETLRYPAACYCPSTLIHTVQHDIFRGNTKISSITLLSSSLNTYLYNMILSEETLKYPASYCSPSTLMHTCTIWYYQNKY
jgi:hypothetical protein